MKTLTGMFVMVPALLLAIPLSIIILAIRMGNWIADNVESIQRNSK
jgi:hypothetical protein